MQYSSFILLKSIKKAKNINIKIKSLSKEGLFKEFNAKL